MRSFVSRANIGCSCLPKLSCYRAQSVALSGIDDLNLQELFEHTQAEVKPFVWTVIDTGHTRAASQTGRKKRPQGPLFVLSPSRSRERARLANASRVVVG